MRIATVGALVSALIALLAIVVNVFTRQVLGFSLFGADELASFAYLWTIWMGVSLAVKRGAVTVITLAVRPRPGLVARVGAGLLGDQPGDLPGLRLLAHHPVRARGGRARPASPRRSQISWFYPVVSMTVGYYFITTHFLQGGRRRLCPRRAAGEGGPARGAHRDWSAAS